MNILTLMSPFVIAVNATVANAGEDLKCSTAAKKREKKPHIEQQKSEKIKVWPNGDMRRQTRLVS